MSIFKDKSQMKNQPTPQLDGGGCFDFIQSEKQQDGLGTPQQNDVGKILNKTQPQLKTEFIKFQLNSIISKIGLCTLDGAKDSDSLQTQILHCKNLGVSQVLSTPFYLPLIKNACKKTGAKNLKTLVATDYPLGQNGLKSKIIALKEVVKQGADGAIVTVNDRAVDFALLGEQRRKTAKTLKACKLEKAVLISCNDLSSIIKTIKALDGIKYKRIYLKFSDKAISCFDSLEKIRAACPKKILCVISNAQTLSDLEIITHGKCDMLFTPHATQLAKSLHQSFNLST